MANANPSADPTRVDTGVANLFSAPPTELPNSAPANRSPSGSPSSLREPGRSYAAVTMNQPALPPLATTVPGGSSLPSTKSSQRSSTSTSRQHGTRSSTARVQRAGKRTAAAAFDEPLLLPGPRSVASRSSRRPNAVHSTSVAPSGPVLGSDTLPLTSAPANDSPAGPLRPNSRNSDLTQPSDNTHDPTGESDEDSDADPVLADNPPAAVLSRTASDWSGSRAHTPVQLPTHATSTAKALPSADATLSRGAATSLTSTTSSDPRTRSSAAGDRLPGTSSALPSGTRTTATDAVVDLPFFDPVRDNPADLRASRVATCAHLLRTHLDDADAVDAPHLVVREHVESQTSLLTLFRSNLTRTRLSVELDTAASGSMPAHDTTLGLLPPVEYDDAPAERLCPSDFLEVWAERARTRGPSVTHGYPLTFGADMVSSYQVLHDTFFTSPLGDDLPYDLFSWPENVVRIYMRDLHMPDPVPAPLTKDTLAALIVYHLVTREPRTLRRESLLHPAYLGSFLPDEVAVISVYFLVMFPLTLMDGVFRPDCVPALGRASGDRAAPNIPPHFEDMFTPAPEPHHDSTLDKPDGSDRVACVVMAFRDLACHKRPALYSAIAACAATDMQGASGILSLLLRIRFNVNPLVDGDHLFYANPLEDMYAHFAQRERIGHAMLFDPVHSFVARSPARFAGQEPLQNNAREILKKLTSVSDANISGAAISGADLAKRLVGQLMPLALVSNFSTPSHFRSSGASGRGASKFCLLLTLTIQEWLRQGRRYYDIFGMLAHIHAMTPADIDDHDFDILVSRHLTFQRANFLLRDVHTVSPIGITKLGLLFFSASVFSAAEKPKTVDHYKLVLSFFAIRQKRLADDIWDTYWKEEGFYPADPEPLYSMYTLNLSLLDVPEFYLVPGVKNLIPRSGLTPSTAEREEISRPPSSSSSSSSSSSARPPLVRLPRGSRPPVADADIAHPSGRLRVESAFADDYPNPPPALRQPRGNPGNLSSGSTNAFQFGGGSPYSSEGSVSSGERESATASRLLHFISVVTPRFDTHLATTPLGQRVQRSLKRLTPELIDTTTTILLVQVSPAHSGAPPFIGPGPITADHIVDPRKVACSLYRVNHATHLFSGSTAFVFQRLARPSPGPNDFTASWEPLIRLSVPAGSVLLTVKPRYLRSYDEWIRDNPDTSSDPHASAPPPTADPDLPAPASRTRQRGSTTTRPTRAPHRKRSVSFLDESTASGAPSDPDSSDSESSSDASDTTAGDSAAPFATGSDSESDTSSSTSSDPSRRTDSIRKRRSPHRSQSRRIKHAHHRADSVINSRTGESVFVSKHQAAQTHLDGNLLFLHLQSPSVGATSGILPTSIDPLVTRRFLLLRAIDNHGALRGGQLAHLHFFSNVTEARLRKLFNFVVTRPRLQDESDLSYRDFANPDYASRPISCEGIASWFRNVGDILSLVWVSLSRAHFDPWLRRLTEPREDDLMGLDPAYIWDCTLRTLDAFGQSFDHLKRMPSPNEILASLTDALALTTFSIAKQHQWEATEKILGPLPGAAPTPAGDPAKPRRPRRPKNGKSATTTPPPTTTPTNPPAPGKVGKGKAGKAKAGSATTPKPPALATPDPFETDCLSDIRHSLVPTSPACPGNCTRTHLAQRPTPIDRKALFERLGKTKMLRSNAPMLAEVETALKNMTHAMAARFSGTL